VAAAPASASDAYRLRPTQHDALLLIGMTRLRRSIIDGIHLGSGVLLALIGGSLLGTAAATIIVDLAKAPPPWHLYRIVWTSVALITAGLAAYVIAAIIASRRQRGGWSNSAETDQTA
jgi:hypothetical protein